MKGKPNRKPNFPNWQRLFRKEPTITCGLRHASARLQSARFVGDIYLAVHVTISGMNDRTIAKSPAITSLLSDREVWAAIRYLEPSARRGVGDLLATMVLCWMILLFSTLYIVLHLRP
jgi:hypothetical protein